MSRRNNFSNFQSFLNHQTEIVHKLLVTCKIFVFSQVCIPFTWQYVCLCVPIPNYLIMARLFFWTYETGFGGNLWRKVWIKQNIALFMEKINNQWNFRGETHNESILLLYHRSPPFLPNEVPWWIYWIKKHEIMLHLYAFVSIVMISIKLL